MKNLFLFTSLLVVSLVMADSAHAQRRGGGGGRSFSGGGGAARNMSGGGAARNMSGGGAARNMSGGSNFNRPSNMGSNYNRPTNSRPTNSRPTNNRPTPNFGSSSNFQRPSSSNFQRPSTSNSPRSGSSRSSTGSFPRPGGSSGRSGTTRAGSAANNRQFDRPSQGQLNDFLNMPKSSSAAASSTRGSRLDSVSSPNEAGGRTFSGENYTIDTVKGKGSGSSNGVDYAGAGAGAVITDSQGNQRVVGKGVGGATDGTSSVAGSGGFAAGKNTDGSAGAVRSGTRIATDGNSVGVARGAAGAGVDSQGNVRAGAAGGWAATDGNTVAGGAGSIRGQSNVDGSGGYVARGARGATDGTNAVVQRGASAGVRDQYGNARGSAVGMTRATDGVNTWGEVGGGRYVKGPGGSVYARGAYASGYNGIVRNYNQVYAVRHGFHGHTHYYTSRWYARYPGAWVAAGIVATAWWTAPTYGYASGYSGCSEQPVSYEYGDDGIYVENGNVYVGDQAVASEEEYYDQANEIAGDFPSDSETGGDAAADEAEGDWLPLGVFAVVSEGQTKSEMTLQLALNKEGMVRGNLKIDLTDKVIQVFGNVDKETQRVALKLEGKDDIVIEAGLYNLTEDVLTVMIHYGKDRQEERGLIRLTQDDESPEGQNSGPQNTEN